MRAKVYFIISEGLFFFLLLLHKHGDVCPAMRMITPYRLAFQLGEVDKSLPFNAYIGTM
jgi:hypothetical protein